MTRSKALRVGKTSAGKRFTLPPEIGVQTTAVHGIRGSGKTYTASVLVEELLEAGLQVVIVDPNDVWFGLKSSADGEGEGYPLVVMGGHHADLPLSEDNGAVLADFAVERGASMILSLVQMRKAARERFCARFAEQLFHRKGELEHRTPLTFVVDEASRFIPQQQRRGTTPAMLGAMEDIVIQGRAFGLGVVLIDQRPARVNKNVLTQLEALVCHRVTSPQDRKALREWFEQKDPEGKTKEFLEGLASLGTGEAWVWSPLLHVFERVHIRERRTFDSSRTPKLGEQVAAPAKVAPIDLDALREQLQETIEEAEAKDPKKLQAEIGRLERQLRKAETTSITRGQLESAREEIREAYEPRMENLEQKLHAIAGHAEDVVDAATLVRKGARAIADLCRNGAAPPPSKPKPAKKAPAAAPEKPKDEKPPEPAPSAEGAPGREDLADAQRRILDALRTLETIGVDSVSRANLAVFSRQSPKSSAYSGHVAHLEKRLGLVHYPTAGMVQLTEGGRDLAVPAFQIATAEDLHDAWYGYLEGAQRRILEAVIDAYPDDVDRNELAGLAGQSHRSSAYQGHVATLEQLGAVEYPEAGRVRATELLFPEGLR